MKVPLSFPAEFVLWFIGTSLNDVKHPTQGIHQLTREQLKYAPAEYKNDLYDTIAKQYLAEPILRRKLQEFKNATSK